MAFVRLTFDPPDIENLETLNIYEAASASGPWGEPIATITDIGSYPTYIDSYTTANASYALNWFAIEWVDADDNATGLSIPTRGESLMSRLVERIMERDPGADVDVVIQEAEFAVSVVMGTEDPWSLLPGDATIRQISGMTYLALARVYISAIVQTSTSTSYVAGLISEKASDTKQTFNNIDRLLELANADLGWNLSLIMVLEDIQIGTSISTWELDQSRLLLTTGVQ